MMQCEQIERGEARRAKAIWHAARHRAQRKSEAPVSPMPKEKGQERKWCWVGEPIYSKGLIHSGYYTSAEIRKAGFKLPRLKKK
jgi:hypothetical protein